MNVGWRPMWPHPKGMEKEGPKNVAEVDRLLGRQHFVGMEWHAEIGVAQMEGAGHFGEGDIGRGRRPKNLAFDGH